jgi:hypothetical protein
MVIYPRGDTEDEVRWVRQEPWQQKAYLVGSIVVPHLHEVLLEDLLVEGSLAHVYDLQWLSMLAGC